MDERLRSFARWPAMTPSLADSYVRVARAREHFDELKELHAEICTAQAEATVMEYEGNVRIEPGEMAEILRVQTAKTPIPETFRVLLGDVVNSLRSALDYLVGQLAILDSGARV